MNTDMILTTAGPLVTEHPWGLSPGALAGGFLMLLGGSILIFVTVRFVRSEVGDESGAVLFVVALAGVAFGGIGAVVVVGESESDGKELNADRVNEVIEAQYRITSSEAAAEGDGPPAAQFCEAVSTKSPEYIGIVEGQQIRFKAGSTNCESEDPDIAIIVTDTPGAALSADDLRKADTTEEP